jgi:NMT1-like family
LRELGGVIDTQSMREMNAAVELEGRHYAEVAEAFLVDRGLLPAGTASVDVEELVLAVDELAELSGPGGVALRAVRKAFPERSVTVVETADPLDAVVQGRARIALVNAASFFEVEGLFPTRRVPAEAVGVVGYELAHVVIPDDSEAISLGEIGRLGVGAPDGASAHSADLILSSLELRDDIELVPHEGASLEAQAEELSQGGLDALFVMAPVGHQQLGEIMSGGDFRLLPLQEWQEGNNQVRFPFLRMSRIPAGTYEGQEEPVETVGAQLVLAGPAPPREAVGEAGPATGLPRQASRLPDQTVTALADALPIEERLHPTLPAAGALAPATPPATPPINPSPITSVVNFVIVLVSCFLFYLFIRKGRPPGETRRWQMLRRR